MENSCVECSCTEEIKRCQCDEFVCDSCWDTHIRECHEDCQCDYCIDRMVVQAELSRDVAEDR